MDLPFSYSVTPGEVIPSHYDNHLRRTLSSLRGQFLDQTTYSAMLAKDDCLLYEVYEVSRPEVYGEMLMGVTVLHPGKVGNEFFMTKGHFHSIINTAEVYYTLRGKGVMVMETPEGDTHIEELAPGKVLYVPPRWAHRSVNTTDEDLAFFFVYPADAGHDYGTIESQGFRKLVMAGANGAEFVDNPRWKK
jgi:glucose-6-phosphate isomerase, archaeal